MRKTKLIINNILWIVGNIFELANIVLFFAAMGYRFDIEIYTKKIRNNLGRDGGRLDIHYKMNIGGADKNVRMKIEV